MVNRRFFHYCIQNSETICDEFDKWDNGELDLDEENLSEYIEIEHKNYGSMYIQLEEFGRLVDIWIGLSKKEKDEYNI